MWDCGSHPSECNLTRFRFWKTSGRLKSTTWRKVDFTRGRKQVQVGQLLPPNRAAACQFCVSSGRCKKCASNIALSYDVDVDKWSLTVLLICFYIMQNYAAFRRWFWRYLEVWTWFLCLGFCFFCIENLGWFLKIQWKHCCPLRS